MKKLKFTGCLLLGLSSFLTVMYVFAKVGYILIDTVMV